MNFIGRFLWLILTIAAISVAMVFAVSNTQQVTLQFWPFTGQNLRQNREDDQK